MAMFTYYWITDLRIRYSNSRRDGCLSSLTYFGIAGLSPLWPLFLPLLYLHIHIITRGLTCCGYNRAASKARTPNTIRMNGVVANQTIDKPYPCPERSLGMSLETISFKPLVSIRFIFGICEYVTNAWLLRQVVLIIYDGSNHEADKGRAKHQRIKRRRRKSTSRVKRWGTAISHQRARRSDIRTVQVLEGGSKMQAVLTR